MLKRELLLCDAALTSRHNIRSICDNYFAVHKFWKVSTGSVDKKFYYACVYIEIKLNSQHKTRDLLEGWKVRKGKSDKRPEFLRASPNREKNSFGCLCNNLIIAFKWKNLSD